MALRAAGRRVAVNGVCPRHFSQGFALPAGLHASGLQRQVAHARPKRRSGSCLEMPRHAMHAFNHAPHACMVRVCVGPETWVSEDLGDAALGRSDPTWACAHYSTCYRRCTCSMPCAVHACGARTRPLCAPSPAWQQPARRHRCTQHACLCMHSFVDDMGCCCRHSRSMPCRAHAYCARM